MLAVLLFIPRAAVFRVRFRLHEGEKTVNLMVGVMVCRVVSRDNCNVLICNHSHYGAYIIKYIVNSSVGIHITLKLIIDTQQYNNHITNLLKQIFAPDIINNIN